MTLLGLERFDRIHGGGGQLEVQPQFLLEFPITAPAADQAPSRTIIAEGCDRPLR